MNKMRSQILVLLEQDENSRQVVKSLSQAGFDVVACQTLTEAIIVLKKQPKIEMIISDVHLERGGNVFDFLRSLKSNRAHVGRSLVLFSFRPTELAKHLEDGLRNAARMLGVAKYITMETFDSQLFCKEIQSVISQQHEVGQAEMMKDAELRVVKAG